MAVDRMMQELAQAAPPDLIIADESVTSRPALMRAFSFDEPGSLFGIRGGALGWAMPGALGVKLANPDRPALAVVGASSSIMGASSPGWAHKEASSPKQGTSAVGQSPIQQSQADLPVGTIPAGRQFRVRLDHNIRTRSAHEGDRVTAILSEAIYAGDALVAEAGDRVIGKIVYVASARETRDRQTWNAAAATAAPTTSHTKSRESPTRLGTTVWWSSSVRP
jgi:hypothetical protein